MQGFHVGKLVVEDRQVLLQVLLAELFLSVDLVLDLLPAVVEQFHLRGGGGEGRGGRAEIHRSWGLYGEVFEFIGMFEFLYFYTLCLLRAFDKLIK